MTRPWLPVSTIAICQSRGPGWMLFRGDTKPARITPSSRARYAHALATEAGVPLEVACFGLMGVEDVRWRGGLHWNAVLLKTVGERIVCVPDACGRWVALDNSCLLPPFMPIGRGATALFATLVRQCHPEANPARVSGNRRAARGEFRGWRLNTIVRAIVSWFEPDVWLAPGAPRLVWLGERLLELAMLPFEEFRHVVNLRLADVLGHQLRAGRPNAPAARASLTAAVPFWPVDVEQRESPLASLARGQELIRAYAQLLQAWPAMVAAAGGVNRRDNGPR